MSTTETIKYTFTSTDGKSLILSYDPAGNVLVQAAVQINGQVFQWSTIEDFQDFVNNIVSMVNIANSPSGTGSGYVPASAGTPGSDAIVD